MPEDIVITESSFRRLQEELNYLRTTKRREVAEALRRARGFGDLSENFEYHAARREQAILNGRIADLERMLERATVVPDEMGSTDGKARLGSKVTVLDLDSKEEWTFTLVDPVQADPLEDLISVKSPVGSAVLDRTVGEEVEVAAPGGTIRYRVVAIT